MVETQCFQADHLHAITRSLFMAANTPRHIADVIAGSLIKANLSGHDSHGVQRIATYLSQIDQGNMDPAAEPSIVRETDITVIWDGNNGSGIYSVRKAMEVAIEKAKKSDVCRASFVRNQHIGRLGEWAEMAAAAGCIGFVTTGGGGQARGKVLPHGGGRGRMGTNPMTVGIPTGDDAPFVLDFATSMIAAGKIQYAKSRDVDLPEGCILDEAGKASVNPDDYYTGGSLLPFGGHKGYGLSVMACLLGGLGGTFNNGTARGTFIQVMDVNAFSPLEEYQKGVREFLDGLMETPPSPGIDKVLVAGEYEHRSRVERLKNGVEVPVTTLGDIKGWAEKLNVDMGEELVEEGDRAPYGG